MFWDAGGMTAEWWMVCITTGSVLVSAMLAWLAYRNGRKATEIAAGASDRDETHRARELDQREREERAQVALAMMRAVSAAEEFAKTQSSHYETAGEIEQEMIRSRAEALARVELYATAAEDDELRPWIESALYAISYPSQSLSDVLEARDYAYFARRGIRLWNLRGVTSGNLIAGKLPPEVPAGETDEAPGSSA